MKLINQFFRYFYSTEVIDSRSQLKEDFGDFPPKPLGGDRLTGNFTIVRVRGIGEHIHNTVMMRRIVEGGADRDSISSTMRNELAIDLDSLKFLGELTGIRKKLILWFALGGIFLASLLNFIRLTPKGMNALGFFAPIRRDEYEIVISRP